jgi:uncharacterized protein (TIGR02270 family)
MSASAEIIETVVLRHVEDAGFLWTQRAGMLRGNAYDTEQRRRFDARLIAHIAGLRAAGSHAFRLCLHALGEADEMALFPAALLAFQYGQRWDVLSSLVNWSRHSVRSIVAASAFAGSSSLEQVGRWLSSNDPLLRALGLDCATAQRVATVDAVRTSIDSKHPSVQLRAVRAASLHGHVVLTEHVEELLRDRDPALQLESALALARFGRPQRHIDEILASAGRAGNEGAIGWLVRRQPDEARSFIELWAREGAARSAVYAAEVLGDLDALRWLVDAMGDRARARVAGQAFHTITGVDLGSWDLDMEAPADAVSSVTDDPDDPNVELDDDDALVWPSQSAVARQLASAPFASGVRYLNGQPIGSLDGRKGAGTAALLDVVRTGRPRQRAFAARELAPAVPSLPVLEVRGPAQGGVELPGWSKWIAHDVSRGGRKP